LGLVLAESGGRIVLEGVEQILNVLKPGAKFHERYEVVGALAMGGMGLVCEVIDRETRRRRALKVMLPGLISDPDMKSRFQLEATVTADIASEHIVEVVDAGIDDATNFPFIVMELLHGADLSTLLQKHGRFPPEEAIAILWQASLALDRTHAAGIVHRDLASQSWSRKARWHEQPGAWGLLVTCPQSKSGATEQSGPGRTSMRSVRLRSPSSLATPIGRRRAASRVVSTRSSSAFQKVPLNRRACGHCVLG
jgi:hypothetical protein